MTRKRSRSSRNSSSLKWTSKMKSTINHQKETDPWEKLPRKRKKAQIEKTPDRF